MKIWILILSLFLSPMIHAQVAEIFDVGNGSIAWVCRFEDKSIRSIKLLEALESEHLSDKWRINKSFKSNDDLKSMLTTFLEKLSRIDSSRAKKYKSILKDFFKNASYVDNDKLMLSDTKDSFSPLNLLEKGCKKENVVSQLNTAFLEKKYIINSEIFNHKLFGKAQQALTVLHEIIYNEIIEEGRSGNSYPVRSFTSFLASQRFSNLLDVENLNYARKVYLKASQLSGLKTAMWKGKNIHLNTIINGRSFPVKPLRFCYNSQIYLAREFLGVDDHIGLISRWSCESGVVNEGKFVEDISINCSGVTCEDADKVVSKSDFLNRSIVEIYRMHLGRSPLASELRVHILKYNSGVTLDEINDHVSSSAEALIRLSYIKNLGRIPDPEGLAFYINLYEKFGFSMEKIDAELGSSPEAKVRKIFLEVMEREPSWNESQVYVKSLVDGLSIEKLKEEIKASKAG